MPYYLHHRNMGFQNKKNTWSNMKKNRENIYLHCFVRPCYIFVLDLSLFQRDLNLDLLIAGAMSVTTTSSNLGQI